jgi:cephalosporin-C deacetylase
MPLIDKPLHELKVYQGINPRPADFDQYWDDAIAEMRSVNAAVDLVPSTFKAPGVDAYDLWFTGVGGARVHAKYLRPTGDAICPGVVQFHGYTGNTGDWSDKLNYVAAGFAIAALDCRGQGGLSEDTGSVKGTTHLGHIIRGLDDPDPKKMLFRQIFLDTAQLAGIVMGLPGIDAEKIGAIGGSQGGALTLACAALEPRIKKAAPAFPFLCDYRRVWEMDLCKDAYAELKTFFRHFDPRHEREDEIFTKLGYIDIQHLASRIKADVLMAVGLMDTICPPSSQFAAFNKITSNKDSVIYPDFGHEGLPGWNDRAFQFLMGLR